ncbi:MAG TPA: hypothetical protein VJ765_06685 [Chitinophagaceae bacterium]|nr:hypothetical protein [Chitinophagaceae bacterium]
MRFYILWSQTLYYLITALWALIDIESFMSVTGPKTDTWLVKTVAVLLLAICICFLAHLFTERDALPVSVLAVTCCVVLVIIDCYYAYNNVISKIYLADALIEFILLICWIFIFIRTAKTPGG